ncbi:unnamed protein product [Tilletia controversa]|uniref:Pirin N-terminal domain-containing protein n=3 Tax=Tilletia TaxID=13289 RepID=A0A8X7MXA5_9BASI|nr:hypothetical protein CF336_g1583 [Tilletia laevis]KAE8203622.1 hypothetical protein CF328_g1554 [Tilletia controversa]KAE8254733.1 hypothetical protein A4X03_0g5672 [Tilletia caries]KAE8207781.1 hypothetical protein CF335_g895 [Tilletia laevis]KAE8252737.1 hypothetical protein A4X06_0g1967 [Tilletia controversa]
MPARLNLLILSILVLTISIFTIPNLHPLQLFSLSRGRNLLNKTATSSLAKHPNSNSTLNNRMANVTSTAVSSANLSWETQDWRERGHADHDWLKTFHSFSFSSWHDPKWSGFANLRVINEDRVAAKTGFPKHPHSNFEIFSYIVGGELTHDDSLGNREVLKRGDVQFTSAGTGIRHSEHNNHPSTPVHFLQIWYTPDKKNLQPRYWTSHTPDELKLNKLVTLIRPHTTLPADALEKTGDLKEPGAAIPAQSSLVTRASILQPGKSVTHIVGAETDVDGVTDKSRGIWVQLISRSGYREPESKVVDVGKIQVGGESGKTIEEGSGAFVKSAKVGTPVEITNVSDMDVEFIVFDVTPA